jgi:predicted Zn-dependent peptidase
MFRSASALLCGLLVALPAAAQERRIEVPHEQYVLGNGLAVILAPDHSLPRVEVNIWYRVGSKDEKPGRSGFAHLFEHLMFMGTARVPSFDVPIEAGGGANNATTSADRTNYFDWGPAAMLETLLWLEADRLESLDEAMNDEKLITQREIVRNERRQNGENRPYGTADLLVNELLYPPGHPNQIDVIGKHEDLVAATVADVTDFFQRFYVPNNASLCVAGDFDPAVTKAAIERYFGDLPAGPEPPRVRVDPVVLDGERRVVLEDKIQFPRLSMVWHSPAYFHPGDAELDLVGDALSNGKASRLYKRLVVEDGSAVDVAAYQASSLLGSQFRVEVYAVPGADLAAIEAAVDEELLRLVSAGPTDAELTRAVAGIETRVVSSLQSLHARADSLNRYLMHYGTPDGFERDLDRYRRATPEGVRAWARSTLDPGRRLVMTVLPEGSLPQSSARDTAPPAPAGGTAFEPPVPAASRRPSGLELWHSPRPGLPLVDVTLVLPGGTLAETEAQAGLATLTASMLEEGAGERDAPAFSDALQQLGASFDVSAGRRETYVSLRVLERNLDAALELFHDAVVRPRMAAEDFERARRLHVEALRQALDDPASVARMAAAAAFYGPGHAYGRPGGGYPETVAALELADVKAFHARLARPQAALLILAGDVTVERAAAIAARLDTGWPRGEPLTVPERLPVPAPAPPRAVLVDRPGASQTIVVFQMPGQAGTDPLRLPADVFNTLLGGSFTSRLNQNLREDKAYTYGAGSRFERAPDQGSFGASAQVRTDVTGASIGEFLAEFERIRAGGIAPEEVGSAASTVRSRIVSGYESLGSTVRTWLALRERGAGPEDAARDLAALPGIDAAQLDALAAGLVPVEHMLLVLVGDAEALLPQLLELPLPPVQRVDERGRIVEAGP